MDDLLTRSIDDLITKEELHKALSGDKKLRLKLGVDPTSPDLHLGHAVILRKLRQFQDAGHIVIFLIGDYTAKIGDPSGKNKTRPVLTDAEIEANAKTYLEQAGKILDIEKAEVRRNSEWLSKLTFNDLLKLAANFTVAQLIEREDFKNRLQSGTELSLHELLYPVMQAYDSVMLEADVEFGGSDQRFNMLAARSLQKKLDQRPQQILMTKLLVGTDGVHKMSKSLGNYVALTDEPSDMFGKIMSIADELIAPYYELCTDIEVGQIEALVKTMAEGANPRDAKASLAREIVRIYHSDDAALKAEEAFNKQFRDKQMPNDLEIKVTQRVVVSDKLLVTLELAQSTSEARRLIDQGGVRLNGQLVDEIKELNLMTGDIVQVGKRRNVQLEVQ